MDHPGNTCTVADPVYHIPNILHDKAHMYSNQGAIMLAHHKPITYGTGASMVWIIANSISKAQFVMQSQQEFARLHQQQQPYYTQNPNHQQYLGQGRNTQKQQPQFGANLSHHHQSWLWQSGAENVEQVNVKTFCDTRPIPTPNNINYYSTLYDEENNEDDKKIIHSNFEYDITDQTDELTDNSSIESIESPKQETLSTKPLDMKHQYGSLFSQEPHLRILFHHPGP